MKSLIATYVMLGLFAIAIFGSAFLYERMLWNECRATNSWFYCVRVLGK